MEPLYMEAEDFSLTTEKLDELKEQVPRAGPKYRLGMYFETIHNLPHFDGVDEPEDGYSSYWETDTEIDSELGNFIFSNVTGDSASVICVDEAVELLELRERKRQMLAGAKQIEAQQRVESKEEHVLERSTDSKRSSASRHSRQSHHSGSDGTYDGPPPPPVPPRRPSSVADHVYETLDDCKEQYQAHMDLIYISKASEGSRGSDDSTAKPVTNDEDSDRSSGKRASKSPPNKHYSKHRNSSSSPQLPDVVTRHRRKLSDGSNLINALQKNAKRSSEVIPKSCPAPMRAYPFPPGVPEQYVDYMATPVAAPPVPERRKGSRAPRPPSLIIKHKGQTFVVPVVDKKLQQRLEKVKGPPQITAAVSSSQPRLRDSQLYGTLPRHATLHTTISRSSSGSGGAPGSGLYQTLVHSHSFRAHASPPKLEPSELIISHKRKGSKHLQNTPPKQVTHYGVI